MRAPARLALSLLGAVIALTLTFFGAFYAQVAIYGEKALDNDAGPQFGVVALVALFAILVAVVTFWSVFKMLRNRES
ncbi:MAG: hypothetical protein WAN10_17765 [Candidatus Acidiferrales bacterium]